MDELPYFIKEPSSPCDEIQSNNSFDEIQIFARELPLGQVLYTNKNIILDVCKKYISLSPASPALKDFLSLNLESISFEDLSLQIIYQNQNDILSIETLYEKRTTKNDKVDIYPNMPICISGVISTKFNKVILKSLNRNETRFIKINTLSTNFIQKEKTFIINRQVFLLGYIKSIEKEIIIDIGAIST